MRKSTVVLKLPFQLGFPVFSLFVSQHLPLLQIMFHLLRNKILVFATAFKLLGAEIS
jgi:hypothetical protein